MERGLLLSAFVAGLLFGPPEADRTGSGWRVRGGTLESAVAGLRVKPPEGWEFVLGDAVEAEDANADLGLLLHGTDLLVTVDAQESLGMTPEERLEEMLPVATLEKTRAPGKPLPVRAGDASFGMEPWTGKDGGLAYWIGGFTADGRAFCVTASCAAASREDSAKRIPEALAALEVLSGKARDSLAAELLALPDGQAAWQGNVSFRRGSLRDFDRRILWRLPKAFWTVYLHDPADAADESEKGLVATFTDRILNVEGTLEWHPLEKKDLAGYQARMVGWFVDQSEGVVAPPAEGEKPAAEGEAGAEEEDEEPTTVVEAALEIDFAGGKGLSTRIHDASGWQWLVVSTARGDTGYTVWFGGEEAAMEAAGGTVTEALAGVAFDPAMKAESQEKGVYRNDLYGFSLALPRQDLAAEADEDAAEEFVRNWKDADVTIHVCVGPPEDPDPAATEALLGGVAGRRLPTDSKEAAVFEVLRDGLAYSLALFGDADLPEERVEAVRAGFRFLD